MGNLNGKIQYSEQTQQNADAQIAKLAYRIADLDKKSKDILDERGDLCDQLLVLMKKHGVKRVPVPDFDVTLEAVDYSSRSQPSKKSLVERWGEEAEQFWNSLPVKEGSRISVKSNRES